ncbi:MAG: DUF3298 and DUF4163 domain-containing protein [Acetanaerobacterium sp.]
MADSAASVNTVVMESELSHQGRAVLHYKIEYPQFTGTYFQRMLGELSGIYKARAQSLQQGRVRELFCQAIGQPASAQEGAENDNDAPLYKYELAVGFSTPYNENCMLSLCFDQYEFTGGAHGNTVRCSDTWNLQRGCYTLLRDLFARTVNYKSYIVENVNKQIAAQMESGDGIFFDDYAALTAKYFNDRQFHLTPEGIEVYYQLYEIAPYVFGIPTFVIPYVPGSVIAPGSGCR